MSVSFYERLKIMYDRLSGKPVEYSLDRYRSLLPAIAAQRGRLAADSDGRLAERSAALRRAARAEAPAPERLAEAFGLVGEACRRTLGLAAFDEQLIAGLALHEGRLAEMQTGEGKTLAAVFPAYADGLAGQGVHILTFNDYLARRDADWMGPIYRRLGLSVGCIQEGMSPALRRQAYAADIVYATAKEAGFDFLRDSLVLDPEETVQRPFHAAIVDEADSILIDEARIPLILAGRETSAENDARELAGLVKTLSPERDYAYDQYQRSVHLTEEGLQRMEQALGCGNLYAEANLDLLTRLNCALHAEYLLRRDRDYILRNAAVELVDEFTGRVADLRRWPDGLQAAVEAKEGLPARARGRVLNTITLQHFLNRYPKLAGMTATARPAAEEFHEFYGLRTVVIPPHAPCIRRNEPDRLYATQAAKKAALAAQVRSSHACGRPVLVGTPSVAESAEMAERLGREGVACQILNAKEDGREAEIIAAAGRLGAVTIATNMAGRGTDIRLGGPDEKEKDQVLRLGGLLVLAGHTQESRRMDQQLAGRAGRQGDPGTARFLVSLEDSLFMKYNLRELLPRQFAVDPADGAIADPLVMARVRQLQRIIEGQNFEIRKTLRRYSELLEQQRRHLFDQRREWLRTPACLAFFQEHDPQGVQALQQAVGEDALLAACRRITLLSLDHAWSHYLAAIAEVRESIHLARFGGQDPLHEFHKQAVVLFDACQAEIAEQALEAFQRLRVAHGALDLGATGLLAPAATWTYQVNDNPFENQLAANLAGSLPLSLAAGLWWPLLMAVSLIRKAASRRVKP